MVHSRTLDGRSLRFGHRGWLWKNAYINYDLETDSLWHHQTGWAMAGPLRGKALARFPTVLTTWAAWRAEHPLTLVLPKPRNDPRPSDRDVYAERNAPLVFGLGVDLPGTFRLYRFADLAAAGGIVQETVDDIPLVIGADPEGRTAFAFDRRVDGAVVDFDLDATDDTAPLLRERGGSRAWSLRSGRLVGSKDTDARLRPLQSAHWETYAWERQHPTGTRWMRDSARESVPARGR